MKPNKHIQTQLAKRYMHQVVNHIRAVIPEIEGSEQRLVMEYLKHQYDNEKEKKYKKLIIKVYDQYVLSIKKELFNLKSN